MKLRFNFSFCINGSGQSTKPGIKRRALRKPLPPRAAAAGPDGERSPETRPPPPPGTWAAALRPLLRLCGAGSAPGFPALPGPESAPGEALVTAVARLHCELEEKGVHPQVRGRAGGELRGLGNRREGGAGRSLGPRSGDVRLPRIPPERGPEAGFRRSGRKAARAGQSPRPAGLGTGSPCRPSCLKKVFCERERFVHPNG